jgi:WD40 repeat protein
VYHRRVSVRYPLAFSPDGKLIYSVEGTLIKAWNAESGKIAHIIGPLRQSAETQIFDFSRDGKTLVVAHSALLTVWNVDEKRAIRSISSRTETPMVFWRDPSKTDDGVVAFGSSDGSLRVMQLKTGVVQSFPDNRHSAEITDLVFSPDGKSVVTGSRDWTIKLWNCKTGAVLGTVKAHKTAVRHVGFSHDGQWIGSSGVGNSLKLWRTKDIANTAK